MLGDHGAYQKMLPYDSCARIPFIVRYPRAFQPGSTREGFVDLNDLLPTVLDVCELEYPGTGELPGGSICRDDKDRSHQYMEYHKENRRWIAMLDAKHKYVYHFGGGRELLFDRCNDPGESVNLLEARPEDADVREARARLRARLTTHEERWGLEGYAQNGELKVFEQMSFDQPLGINNQFPHFHENLVDPAEKNAMNDFDAELLQAAAPEQATMKLSEMALDDWCDCGGSATLAQKIRQEKL